MTAIRRGRLPYQRAAAITLPVRSRTKKTSTPAGSARRAALICSLRRAAGTRTQPGQAPAFHRGAAAIALRGAKIVTPVIIKVSPTTLTKAEPWYRIPHRRVHFSFRVGADIDPQTFAAQGPAPQASRKLNDYLHDYFIKELAADERSEHR